MARGAHYGPSPADLDLPRKRQKTEDVTRNSHRNRSHSPEKEGASKNYGRGDSYRPGRDRGRNFHSARRGGDRDMQHNSYRPSRGGGPPSHHRPQGQNDGSDTNVPKNQKSRRDRKENPSTRMRSLKNLLNREDLPPTIRRDKERELAALVFEREKNKIREERRKNLERYHFIRFIERQKATRELKKLQNKSKSAAGEKGSDDLDQKIHVCNVDLMYTQYAPLGEKYISLYAAADVKAGREKKPHKVCIQPKHLALLDEDQKNELQRGEAECAKSIGTIIRASGLEAEAGTPMKPPRWYDVEEAMKEDGMSKLEALRDGKGPVSEAHNLVLDLKARPERAGDKRKPEWLDDDGVIDPADLDSDSDADMQDGGAKLDDEVADDNDNDDDEMSDGDGGFFERR